MCVVIKLDAMEPGERMNVYVKVVHVSETEEIKRYDGGSIKQAIVVVGDSDGVVKLIAKNGIYNIYIYIYRATGCNERRSEFDLA